MLRSDEQPGGDALPVSDSLLTHDALPVSDRLPASDGLAVSEALTAAEPAAKPCNGERSQPDSAELPSLAKLMAEESGPLCRERAIEIIIQASERLSKRHLAHGSLTPDSLHLCSGNKGEEVLLVETEQASPGTFSVYAAPELLEGKKADARADVYSLGVILYEMMSNKNSSAAQIDAFSKDISKWLAHSPTWSSTPSVLKLIIRKCLQEEPTLRYRNANELKVALQNFLRPHRARSTSNILGNTLAVAMLFLAVLCIYQFSVPAEQVALVAPSLPWETSGASPAARPVRELTVVSRCLTPLSESELGVLSKYELVILQDQSGSMTEFDCPLSGILTSRWDWASRQVQSFARQSFRCWPHGFSLLTFNQEAERFDNCNEEKLAQIYRSQVPRGSTELDKALDLALAKRDTLNKPLAVIVITDGMPNDQDKLEKNIVKAGNADSMNDLRLLFLTVGTAPAGDRFLSMLETNLQSQGANVRALSTMPFKKLERVGLGHAIAQALEPKQKQRTDSK